MAEAVRGRVCPVPSSMLSDALYSGMNAGSWRRAGTRVGEGGFFWWAKTVKRGSRIGPNSRKGPHVSLWFAGEIASGSPCGPIHDRIGWLSRSRRLHEVCRSALEMP